MIPAVAPLVRVKSPSMVDAAMTSAAVPPSMVTSASVPALSLVVIVNAPLNALLVSSNVIVASLALVTRVVVPVMVRVPLSVILPVVAVAEKLPSILEAASITCVALTTVA